MEKTYKDIHKFMISNIFVVTYSPVVYNSSVESRIASSLLYIQNGCYRYSSETVDFLAEKNSIVYLPKGSTYQYSVVSERAKCIQVTFDLEQVSNHVISSVRFSSEPVLLSPINNNACENMFLALQRSFDAEEEFNVLSSLYGLLAYSLNIIGSRTNNVGDYFRIKPAIEFIKKNYTKRIEVEELAFLCNMSQSHLRRLFHKHLNMSPISYKNNLLVEMACNLIRNENMSISEIAYTLQFNDIYTFSQFFKKEKGISPKKYAEQCRIRA